MLYTCMDEGYIIYERFFVFDKFFNELKVAFIFPEKCSILL